MPNTSDSKPRQEDDRKWLRLLRVSALASCLLVAPGLFIGMGPLLPILATPFLAAYLIVLFGVSGADGKRALQLGRAVAMFGCYSTIALLLALTFLLGLDSGGWIAYMGLFALAQRGVMVSARELLLSKEGPAVEQVRWPRIVAAAGVLVFVVLLLAAIILPGLLRSRMAAREASTVSSLRRINDCLAAYGETHPDEGLPGSLREMGPENIGCLDTRLVQGEREGYRFTYAPGAPGPEGQVSRYIVSARPTSYGRSGQRSFYSDESGGIRYTTEDRAAQAGDLLLP